MTRNRIVVGVAGGTLLLAVVAILILRTVGNSEDLRTRAGITYGVFDEPTLSDSVQYEVVFGVDGAGCLTVSVADGARTYFAAIPKAGSVTTDGVDLGDGRTVPFGTEVGVGRTGEPTWEVPIASAAAKACGNRYEVFSAFGASG